VSETLSLYHILTFAYLHSTDTCPVMAMGAIAGCTADQTGMILFQLVDPTQMRCTKAHATDGVGP
jgi:hypothetical protein